MLFFFCTVISRLPCICFFSYTYSVNYTYDYTVWCDNITSSAVGGVEGRALLGRTKVMLRPQFQVMPPSNPNSSATVMRSTVYDRRQPPHLLWLLCIAVNPQRQPPQTITALSPLCS
ncbi:hypothetical protein RJT34_04591 [Clitoria ternatea]|uniref:Secreted protein n=1 Tax=Clitoria ternatea TaxID=43366 RepID=A0AAN9Q6B4_CLITE